MADSFIKNFELFENAYVLCARQPDKYLSGHFKRFVDKLLPQNFFKDHLKVAMITGYYLRCTEAVLNQQVPRAPDKQIQNILTSTRSAGKKIEEITNYLDKHNKVGLPEKISNYSFISFEDTQKIFETYAEDFISHTTKGNRAEKNKLDTFRELVYRNMSFGYLYKLSEEFVEKNKK